MPASSADIRLPLRIGARTLGHVRRRLVRIGIGLEEALAARPPALPPLAPGDDGYWLRGLPRACLAALPPGLLAFPRQRYARAYAPLDGDLDAYMAGFSGKSRATLRRKARRFAEADGGRIDARLYRTPDEMAAFHALARSVSRRTYQERLLAAGLPEGAGAVAEMRALAERDAARGFLLFLRERPVAYLYLPAAGDTLVYAHLGHDPDAAALSPGSVLQLEAMRMLIAEGRFRFLDFTEGEGRHKALFGRGAVDSLDLLLLRPRFANRLAGNGLAAFDGGVALARAGARRLGVERLARRLAR